MATVVKMPRQGQSVESCILTEWYKEEGDQVSNGELLYAYETDKAAFEEEAPTDGFLLARFFEPGDEVPVLQNVAVIGVKGEASEEFKPEVIAVSAEKQETPVDEVEENSNSEQSQSLSVISRGKISISPRARKLAKEKRVAIEAVQGSGPGGRIIERDILVAITQGKRLTPLAQKKMEAEGLIVPGKGNTPFGKISAADLLEPTGIHGGLAPSSDQGSFSDVPLSNVRKIIATAMHRSLQNSAQLTHHLSANASPMLQFRREVKARQNEGYPYNITLNDMVCYAVIRALKQHPDANAHFLGEAIRKFDQVNLGLAVDTDRGLMVPALVNASGLSLPELSVQLKEIAKLSKQGNISPDLLLPEAGSFTVSNLGNYGVEMFTPVINLPQVAILGINTIIQRPTTLRDGSFGFQPFMGLSLTYDHRAIDGGPATLFLAEIKNEVEKLSSELL
jgi:pyruvate dehydrogenase E2 component (dihydrolipoamide acetyltransferase)